jgi:Ala-tRNA(Pro) deacylase
MNNVCNFLHAHNIAYTLHEHPPVFTCEEADVHCGNIPGIACKNLFLRNKKGKRYFLVILSANTQFNLKQFAELVGEKSVSFASTEALREKLGLEPGSVSPFGLLNDSHNEVEVYIGSDVYAAETVSFHPNVNTASLELSKEMFRKFLAVINRAVTVIDG